MSEKGINRRDFIRLSAVGVTAVSLENRLKLKKRKGKPQGESAHRWAMVIDLAKCIGCGDCTLACQAHNDVSPDIVWNRLIESGLVNGKPVPTPVPCMHCQNAPCVDICPVGATYHRADGIVVMDYDRCIGCRYCQMACPYGARSFNWEQFTGDNPTVPAWGQPEVERRPRGVVEKCSFCFQRIDRGLQNGYMPGVDREATPACVNACPVGARLFGDLNDPDSPVSQALARHPSYRLREDLGTAPRVYYLPARKEESEEVGA